MEYSKKYYLFKTTKKRIANDTALFLNIKIIKERDNLRKLKSLLNEQSEFYILSISPNKTKYKAIIKPNYKNMIFIDTFKKHFYIKVKRIKKNIDNESIKESLNKLIKNGKKIIYSRNIKTKKINPYKNKIDRMIALNQMTKFNKQQENKIKKYALAYFDKREIKKAQKEK